MKRSPFILVVISAQLVLIFFLIYKNSRIVELSFQKQQQEKIKHALLKERERLQQKLCMAQDKTAIRHYAQRALTMEKINPKAIKSLFIES